MDQDKARDFFWQIVVDNGADLSALLDASPIEGLQAGLQRISRIVQTLRDAAANIDPLLTAEVDQVPPGDSPVLRIAISCNHEPDGTEAVQALVAAAPEMPPRIQVCAFSQPTPRDMARELALPAPQRQAPSYRVPCRVLW
jgi:hypothetical protein